MRIQNTDLLLVICVKKSSYRHCLDIKVFNGFDVAARVNFAEVIGSVIFPTDKKEQFARQLHPLCRAAMIPITRTVFQHTFMPQQKEKDQ